MRQGPPGCVPRLRRDLPGCWAGTEGCWYGIHESWNFKNEKGYLFSDGDMDRYPEFFEWVKREGAE